MTILIVEDDPSVRELLVALISHRARHATILTADNLDDAVRLLHPQISQITQSGGLVSAQSASSVDAVLCDGTFPAFPNRMIRFDSPHNAPRIMWQQLLGYANKRGIPFVLLTGQASEIEYAKRRAFDAVGARRRGERHDRQQESRHKAGVVIHRARKVWCFVRSLIDGRQIIEVFYLSALSRFPTTQEQMEIEEWLRGRPSRGEALEELAWSLIASRKFADSTGEP